MPTEADQLADKARRGETGALEAIIELFYAKIYAFLRRLVGNDADAADLTQKTFGRVWRALPAFEGRSTLGSWIHSIAYYTYVDWRRGNHRAEPRSPEWWTSRVCASPGPDELAMGKDLAARLNACVDQLAPDLRETVHLHYFQELTLQETADAMSVATSTVKYRLRQALNELENQMNPNPAPILAPRRR